MSLGVTSRDPRRTTPRTVAQTVAFLLLGWAALLGIVLAVGWLLVHPLSGSIGKADNDLARWFVDRRTSSLDGVADLGTLFGETVNGASAGILVALAFSAWRRTFRPILFMAVALAGVGGIYYLAARVDPRPRPPVEILDPGLVPTHSFPSGHVGTATTAYVGIVVLTWVFARAARWWVTPLLLLPFFVLLSRLYQGAHHLSDVLTSLVYASVWLAMVASALLVPWDRHDETE